MTRRRTAFVLALGLVGGCVEGTIGRVRDGDVIEAGATNDATENEPGALQADIIEADSAADVTESEPNSVCSNALITWDCPRFVADEICARNPPCHVCPQDWLPDGSSPSWMAVQQPPSCPCPPTMNGGPPHPG